MVGEWLSSVGVCDDWSRLNGEWLMSNTVGDKCLYTGQSISGFVLVLLYQEWDGWRIAVYVGTSSPPTPLSYTQSVVFGPRLGVCPPEGEYPLESCAGAPGGTCTPSICDADPPPACSLEIFF
jgi:hypothetical protein